MKANIWRTVESQAKWGLQNNIPGDIIDISILEEFVQETKPGSDLERQFQKQGYSVLVYTQFLYPVPVPPEKAARFRPPYHLRNVFYGASDIETSLHEAAFYFMRERINFKSASTSAEPKTIFQVGFEDRKIKDITKHKNILQIMDRHNYSASHAYIKETICDSVFYPSARKSDGRCIATFEITHLDKVPIRQLPLRFTFDLSLKACRVDQESGELWIRWEDVS